MKTSTPRAARTFTLPLAFGGISGAVCFAAVWWVLHGGSQGQIADAFWPSLAVGVSASAAVWWTATRLAAAAEQTAALHRSESVLREVQRIGGVGTCIYHVTTGQYQSSPEFLELVGVSDAGPEHFACTERLLDLLHPEDRPRLRQSLDRLKQGQAQPPQTARLLHPTRGERIIAIEHTLLPGGHASEPRVLLVVKDISERVAAARALAEKDGRIGQFMQAIPGVLFQLQRGSDKRLRIVYIGEGSLELFGLSAEQMIRHGGDFIAHPKDENAAALLSALEQSAETLKVWHAERHVLRPDGTRRWIRFSATPLRDAHGTTVIWHGIALDITAGKRAEEALRESEERLRLTQYAVDHVTDAVAIITPEGDRIYVNDEACRITGYSREELLGTKIWSTFDFLTPESYAELWKQLRASGTEIFEAALKTKSGEARAVEMSLSFIEFSGRQIVFLMARDVTTRKMAEQALRTSEERLRFTQFALDQANDIISIFSRDGRRLYVNEAYCRFTGWRREELLQGRVWDLVPSLNEDRFASMWDDVKRHSPLTFEIELRTRAGVLKPVELCANYLNFAGTEACCAIARDLTARRAAELEKKRMQQQLQETQKLESLGVLAGGIAHDFNNLLTGVLGNASLARDRLSDASDLNEPLRQIERAATRASELCQQMLAYAGKGRFVVEPVNLSRLVEDTSKLLDLSVARRARLQLRLDASLPPVLADATQLRQIVMNLVINAAEAIAHNDGAIIVSTGRMRIDQAFLRSARLAVELPEGEGVFLEVSDNGAGMDRDTLERIFEPFFTTKFTGRGLGLAAVLGIVRSHRGALQVESEPGRGTTFRLVLPPHGGSPAPPGGTPPIFESVQQFDGRILVVDDEESVRSVSRQALERIGIKVDVAEDGEVALAKLAANPQAYALILLDYTMPKLDGAQTLREIRRLNQTMAVVVMSGFPEQETRERLGDQPLSGFMQKPFDIAQLRRCVRDHLAKTPS